MKRFTRRATPVLCLAVAHLAFLAQGAMLGCGFSASAAIQVDDNMDNPNAYTCNCRCGTPVTATFRVAANFDDAEQTLLLDDTDGAGDLDLGAVLAGLRFTNVVIPPGATITSAALQFTSDQGFAGNNTTPLTLDVFGEGVDSATSFGSNFSNLAARTRTTASIGWNVPAWTTNQAGAAQRSPQLKTIIQEIVNRPGWHSGNALALFLAGSGGKREAESFDGNASKAAFLEVQFSAATDQALNVCMPASLNPNLKDANGMQQPLPSDMSLQNDCSGRVETTLTGLAEACDYPPMCECTAEPTRAFNDSCNDPCTEVPLSFKCGNFDPVGGNTTATNAPGDAPVCVVSRNSARVGPSALTAGAFGQVSQCAVEGPAAVDVGDEHKNTQAQGVVEFSGKPCPGGQCNVGVAYHLGLDPITFEVRFATDPVFEDLTSSGASTAGAAALAASGIGQLATATTESSLRGRRDSNTKAYVIGNPGDVGVIVKWEDHTCALFGDVVGTADGETSGDETLKAEVSVTGDILNEPPHANAGADQNLECNSTAGAPVILDGRGSFDPEKNLVLLAWTRGDRVGPSVGVGATQVVQQGLGAPVTYVLRAIDDQGQTDEDSAVVGIVDTGAPSLALSVKPDVLLKLTAVLVPIKVTLTTTDTCDGTPIVRLKSITSNDGVLADGGHSSTDVQGASFGTDDRDFQLRATRTSLAQGRVYSITYEVADHSGNKTTSVVVVSAPKVAMIPYNPPVRH